MYYVCMYIYIYIYICVCIYTYTYTYIHIRMYYIRKPRLSRSPSGSPFKVDVPTALLIDEALAGSTVNFDRWTCVALIVHLRLKQCCLSKCEHGRKLSQYCPALFVLRPIFKLRISKFGVWVKRILTSRRWVFLAHRLIS